MIEDFWHGEGQPGDADKDKRPPWIGFGAIGEPNADFPGTYKFSSTDGRIIPDALLLQADADTKGGGEFTKPRPGSMCICVMPGDGAQAFVHGFLDPVKWDDESDVDTPSLDHQPGLDSSGDKVYKTVGGAKLMLRRGGLVIVEGGPGVSILLGPTNNQMTLRSANFSHIVNGYKAHYGRKELGKTDPETKHEEEYWNQVGPSYDRVKLRHGDLEDDARRELTITEVVIAGGRTTTITKLRETYYNDGRWIGEGLEYRWGGASASEPIVLGNELVTIIKRLTSLIRTITVPTAWGPSGVPINAMSFTNLIDKRLDEILSEYMFVTKTTASV